MLRLLIFLPDGLKYFNIAARLAKIVAQVGDLVLVIVSSDQNLLGVLFQRKCSFILQQD